MQSRTLLSFLVWPFFFFRFTLVTHCWCLHGPDPHDPLRVNGLILPITPLTSLTLHPTPFLFFMIALLPWRLCTVCSLCLECSTPILFTWSTSHPSDVSWNVPSPERGPHMPRDHMRSHHLHSQHPVPSSPSSSSRFSRAGGSSVASPDNNGTGLPCVHHTISACHKTGTQRTHSRWKNKRAKGQENRKFCMMEIWKWYTDVILTPEKMGLKYQVIRSRLRDVS